MSSRILTSDVIGIDALLHDHHAVLAKSTGGAVAVFANNTPAFYAVTPARMAELLALEEKLSRPGSDVALDAQFYEEPEAVPVAIPCGKFAMYPPGNPMRTFSARLLFGASRFGSQSLRKSWRRLSPTGRRKERFFTISSGSKSLHAAYKLAVPVMAGCRNATSIASANLTITFHQVSGGNNEKCW